MDQPSSVITVYRTLAVNFKTRELILPSLTVLNGDEADFDADDDHGLHVVVVIRAFPSVGEHVLATVKECDGGRLLHVRVGRGGEVPGWN